MRHPLKMALGPEGALPAVPAAACGAGRHPNEVDLRRISRALGKRVRYRYVSPAVEAVAGGYRIVSPCCSRNIDPSGGIIDIARLEYDQAMGEWRLYRKDHGRSQWLLHARSLRLDQLMAQLNEDPSRVFWQ